MSCLLPFGPGGRRVRGVVLTLSLQVLWPGDHSLLVRQHAGPLARLQLQGAMDIELPLTRSFGAAVEAVSGLV